MTSPSIPLAPLARKRPPAYRAGWASRAPCGPKRPRIHPGPHRAAVLKRLRYALRSNRIHASYDQPWSECGGQDAGDGFHRLPPEAPRPLADVASRKRAQYARRQAMTAEVRRQIRGARGQRCEAKVG